MKLLRLSLVTLLALNLFCPLAFAEKLTADELEKGLDSKRVNEEKPTLQLSEVQSDALELLKVGKLHDAYLLIKESCDKGKKPSVDMIYLLSILEWKEQKYKDCIKSLNRVIEADKKSGVNDVRRQVLLMKRKADCFYQDRILDKALKIYLDALELSNKLPESDRLPNVLYEDVIGTLIYSKEYDRAETYAKKLLAISEKQAAEKSIDDVASLLWAQLQMMNLYRIQGKEKERLLVRVEAAKLLDSLLTLRSSLDEAGKIPTSNDLKQWFLNRYVKANNPKTLAEYLWLASDYRPHSLPIIEWRPKDNQKAKAVILCIHGLGLDNTAFAPFGHRMSERGYAVYALDVRGFGSWLTIPGQEDVGFKDALNDIKGTISFVKERHPNTPVYLLGESMGGGMALRAGAQFGDIVNGIIASVPSAERFQDKRMGLTVAVHLLRDSDRPFNIGHTVATNATTDEALKHSWEESYKSKMKMTPVELMKFAVFMRTTLHHCKKIKDTPVFIVQGLKDRLVKPQGTYKMFDAVNSEDKTMMIVGTAEHLIFETDNQSEVLLNSLTSWFEQHKDEPTID